jgi:hypothetical protein
MDEIGQKIPSCVGLCLELSDPIGRIREGRGALDFVVFLSTSLDCWGNGYHAGDYVDRNGIVWYLYIHILEEAITNKT